MKTLSLNEIKFALEELSGSIACLNEFGQYLFVNNEFKKYFLKKDTSVLGKTNHDLFSSDTANNLDSNNLRVLKLGITQSFEEIFSNDKDTEYWLSLKKPIFSFDGKIKLLIIFSTNITARKKLEAQLGLSFLENDLGRPIAAYMYQSDYFMYLDQGARTFNRNNLILKNELSTLEFFKSFNKDIPEHYQSMKEIYEIVLHELPGNVFWKDKDLKIKLFSKALANDCGLDSVNEAVGKTNYDFCDPEAARSLSDLDYDIINNKKTVVVEESSKLLKNNKIVEKFYLSKKKCVYNPYTKEYELIGTALDFTLRKRIEINFRKTLNKQFLEQEAKDTFLANISHDIRTPITGMLGLIDDIRDNAKHLPNVLKNISTLKSITNEFLTLFNSILNTVEDNESDLCTSNKIVFNLYDEIENSLMLFRPILDNDIVTLECISDDPSALYYANINVIKRILINLIGNAVKFTQKGQIQVIANYNQGILDLIVKDTGIGISKKNIANIFNEFAQDDTNKELKIKGYGLGLYMVKKYIKLLSGEVKVESKLGKGSIFKLTIPIERSSIKMNEKTLEIKKTKRTNVPTDHSKARILIVEDNVLAGKALSNMVEHFNYDVIVAKTGAEALKCAKKDAFEYIFLDLGLPDQSGIDILNEFRHHVMTKNTPVFIVSGHISKDVHKACIDAGANNTFIKPMSLDQVKDLIDT